MRLRSLALVAALAVAAPAVAEAMPLVQPIPLAGAEAPTVVPAYYGWHGGWHRWHRGYYGWHRHWGWRRWHRWHHWY